MVIALIVTPEGFPIADEVLAGNTTDKTTLKDITYVEAARVMAERVLHARGSDEPAALAFALRLVTSRPPSAEETALLAAQLAKLRATYRNDPPAAQKLVTVGEAPRDEKLDAVEHAAWSSLCLLLLNLDEALTKG